MNKPNCQFGFISTNTMFMILFFGGLFFCVFRIGPHYLDNWAVQGALKSLSEQESNLGAMDKRDIYRKIENFMMINNVRGEEGTAFKVVRKNDRVLINNVYEKRVPMFANIEVLLIFKSQLDTSQPELCCEYLIEAE
ncbi:DUF4845 domain-containing protein [Teredinibacter purpureus]|uniref:DUF4845 domain-containing protein n=1 Tax=Teredinibacter purpureus TaxID=2731756 RepID=UPI0005F87AEA|nr:DUF4845 domain-containing protein [Teredinibacter purpureus]